MLSSPDLRPVYRVMDVSLALSTHVILALGRLKQEDRTRSGSRPVWAQSETKGGEGEEEDQGDGRGGGKIGGARRGGEGKRGIRKLLTTCNLTWPKGKRGNKRANSSGAGYQKQASVGWTDIVVNVFPVLLKGALRSK